jgi:hypothetical protein
VAQAEANEKMARRGGVRSNEVLNTIKIFDIGKQRPWREYGRIGH